MKAAAFDYRRPASLAEACALLAEEPEARLIAGGQTLVPMMAMRLARPTRLIDIARLEELSFIRDEGEAVAIGAATRQCILERDPIVRTRVPLLDKVMPFVGHPPIRARGTIGGSLANADPAAEIGLVAVTLGAVIVHRTPSTRAETPADRFFTAPMTTALPPAGCLTCVRFPVWRAAQVGVGFHEVSARRGDFAFAAAAAQLALDADGICRRLALGIGAVTAVPLRLDAVARALEGTRIDAAAAREAVGAALADIEPLSDLHASAAYRRRVAISLAVRAILDAEQRARAGGAHAH
jgi:CO/xanthine dehydrogenase FAD-binding subunit